MTVLKDEKLYYVGGVVRDEILGIESFDTDLCYEGNAIEFAEKSELEIVRKNPDFGTVRVLINGKETDIASPIQARRKRPPKNKSQDTTGHSTVLQCYRGQSGRDGPHEQRHAPSVEMRPRTAMNRAWPYHTNGTPSPMGRRYYLRPLFLRGEEGPEVFRMKSKNFFAFRYA